MRNTVESLVLFLTYSCAFIGAGWFGDWVYQLHHWDTSYTYVVGAGLLAGAFVATLKHRS